MPLSAAVRDTRKLGRDGEVAVRNQHQRIGNHGKAVAFLRLVPKEAPHSVLLLDAVFFLEISDLNAVHVPTCYWLYAKSLTQHRDEGVKEGG